MQCGGCNNTATRCAPNILIIGGSRDIGFELAKRYAMEKSRIMIVSRNDVDLERAGHEIRSAGASAIFIMKTDVNDRNQVDNMLDSAQELLGCIDVIVYNAGESMQACFRTIERLDDFESVIATNYTALLYTARRAVEILSRPVNRDASRPYECEAKWRAGLSQFVATIGIGGQTGIPEWSLYSGAKHAAVGFLTALRHQVVNDVEVVIAYPNLVDSSRVQNMITADGTRSGPLGKHVLDMWWYKDELFFQSTEEAAKMYFEGISSHHQDIFFHALDSWAASMRGHSPEIADLLHFLAFRVSTRSFANIPTELAHALQEVRNLHKAFKLCGVYDPCVSQGSNASLPDIIKITATRKRLQKQVDIIKEADKAKEELPPVQRTSQLVPPKATIVLAKRKAPLVVAAPETTALRASPVVTLPESFLSSMQ